MEMLSSLIIVLFVTTFIGFFFIRNTMLALLVIVLLFCESALILLVFKIEFIGYSLIIVYIGAIAMLLLFIVMMTALKEKNIKITKSEFTTSILVAAGILACFYEFTREPNDHYMYVFLFEFICNCLIMFLNAKLDLHIEPYTTPEFFGQIIYTDFLLCVIIIGLLLLVAVLGAITITFSYSDNTKDIENTNKQKTKDDKTVSFFKKKDTKKTEKKVSFFKKKDIESTKREISKEKKIN